MLQRAEIIDKLCEKGYTKKDAGVVIDDIVNIITSALVNGEEVMLHGFGKFSVKEHIPKQVTDPKTKTTVTVPRHLSPKFTPGKLLKRAVREGFIRE